MANSPENTAGVLAGKLRKITIIVQRLEDRAELAGPAGVDSPHNLVGNLLNLADQAVEAGPAGEPQTPNLGKHELKQAKILGDRDTPASVRIEDIMAHARWLRRRRLRGGSDQEE